MKSDRRKKDNAIRILFAIISSELALLSSMCVLILSHILPFSSTVVHSFSLLSIADLFFDCQLLLLLSTKYKGGRFVCSVHVVRMPRIPNGGRSTRQYYYVYNTITKKRVSWIRTSIEPLCQGRCGLWCPLVIPNIHRMKFYSISNNCSFLELWLRNKNRNTRKYK